LLDATHDIEIFLGPLIKVTVDEFRQAGKQVEQVLSAHPNFSLQLPNPISECPMAQKDTICLNVIAAFSDPSDDFK